MISMDDSEKILKMLEQMKSDIDEIKTDVTYIKVGQKEHGQFLDSLKHSSEVNKAEIDNLSIEVAKTSGSVKSIETEINKLDEKLTDKIDKIDEKLTDKINKIDEKLTDKIDKIDTKIDDLANDLNTIDQVTEKNLYDITKLKLKIIK